MAKTDKDIRQKELAIRFCVQHGMLPFLEVDVENRKELSETSTVITDVDVMGVVLNASGGVSRTIFDCKTLGKTSPINRAFWAAGLMRYIEADDAFVILRKRASNAHRLSAKHMGVHLFDEGQFTSYAEAFALDFDTDYCYSTDIQNWLNHRNLYESAGNFSKFGQYLNAGVPLESHPERGLKRLVAALQKGAGEFDPGKPRHVAIFMHALMAFAFFMAKITHDLKAVIDFDSSKEEYEKILRFYIWGGRESYMQRKHMADLFSKAVNGESSLAPELKEWGAFIELTRKLLDAPAEGFRCAQVAREFSLRTLAEPVAAKDKWLANFIAESSRTRQFLSTQSKYLVKSVGLPSDFEGVLREGFDQVKVEI